MTRKLIGRRSSLAHLVEKIGKARKKSGGTRPGRGELVTVIDGQALDRILAAVGSEPTTLDRTRLLANLEWAMSVYAEDAQRGRLNVWRRRLARYEKMARLSREMIAVLDANEADKWLPASFDRLAPSAATTYLHTIADWGETWIALMSDLGLDGARRADISPPNWLMGAALPAIYEINGFGRAGLSRSLEDGRVGGPMVRFISSALGELGVTKSNGKPYAPETIASAVKDVRHNRPKRKGPKPQQRG